MLFIGEYCHTFDSKNRITIPAKLREGINTAEEGYGFYIVPGYDGVLSLYTPRTHTQMASESSARLFAVRDVRSLRRLRFGLTVHVEVDQLGRILVPGKALERARIGKNVAIVGVQDHIEIWDRERWETFVRDNLASQDRLAESAFEKERGGQ